MLMNTFVSNLFFLGLFCGLGRRRNIITTDCAIMTTPIAAPTPPVTTTTLTLSVHCSRPVRRGYIILHDVLKLTNEELVAHRQ